MTWAAYKGEALTDEDGKPIYVLVQDVSGDMPMRAEQVRRQDGSAVLAQEVVDASVAVLGADGRLLGFYVNGSPRLF